MNGQRRPFNRHALTGARLRRPQRAHAACVYRVDERAYRGRRVRASERRRWRKWASGSEGAW